jgi:hypothetical protein
LICDTKDIRALSRGEDRAVLRGRCFLAQKANNKDTNFKSSSVDLQPVQADITLLPATGPLAATFGASGGSISRNNESLKSAVDLVREGGSG